ncbi:uncharacterized protein LOC143226738 [Tachypleus tridentatus]|uniref:uncharacterized protein LOC143226738 n=1 Tax=Tachypleus tridentatus TaxID=6853 RepID=UPI003FD4B076
MKSGKYKDHIIILAGRTRLEAEHHEPTASTETVCKGHENKDCKIPTVQRDVVTTSKTSLFYSIDCCCQTVGNGSDLSKKVEVMLCHEPMSRISLYPISMGNNFGQLSRGNQKVLDMVFVWNASQLQSETS